MSKYSILDTEYEERIKILNPKRVIKLEENHYYLQHTQLDMYSCKDGRITINPFAICKGIDYYNPHLYFINSRNILLYESWPIVKKNPNEFLYDITNAINNMNIQSIQSLIDNERKNFINGNKDDILYEI